MVGIDGRELCSRMRLLMNETTCLGITALVFLGGCGVVGKGLEVCPGFVRGLDSL